MGLGEAAFRERRASVHAGRAMRRKSGRGRPCPDVACLVDLAGSAWQAFGACSCMALLPPARVRMFFIPVECHKRTLPS